MKQGRRWVLLQQTQFILLLLLLSHRVAAEECPYPCVCHANSDAQQTLTVDCRNQELFEIPLGVPPTTSHLDVSYNSIRFVRAVDLPNLPALTYLQLHTNDIVDIEAGAFQNLPSLQALTLQNNLLQSLRPGTFTGLSNLQSLNLFNNYLAELDPDLFRPLNNLVTLDLAYNSLEEIRTGTFANFSRLFDLNLGENFIGNIERGSIANLPFLRTLNIEGNQLQFVTTDAWTNVRFLHSLRVDRNPLECGCRVVWLREWFLARSLRGPVTCATPSNLVEMNLLELSPADFCILPTASIMETHPQVLAEGDTLQLTCSTTGAPPPTVFWSREGVTLNMTDPRLDVRGNTLVIEAVTVNDSDRYFCSATSSAGTTATSIDVAVVRTTDPIPPPSNATIGDTVILECDNDLPISVETTWRLRPSPLESNDSVEVDFTMGRFVMGERGGLVVFDVQPEDMGRYECVLADGVSLFRDLQLQAVPMISLSPEPPCQTPDTITTTTADSITLTCDARGAPTPQITLVTPNPERGNITGEGSVTVFLIPPQLEDSGEYACIAVNDVGVDVRRFTINIMAALNLNATIFIGLELLVGDTVILNCTAPGTVMLDFVWRRLDNRPFAPGTVQTAGGNLIIPQLMLDDISVYQCDATLPMGLLATIEYGVSLFEAAFIGGQCPQPERRFATEGDEVRLNCTIRGNGRPNLEWLFGNETIVEGGQFEFFEDTTRRILGTRYEELVINNVRMENMGVYTCAAANMRGTGSYSYLLEVQEAIMAPFFRQQPLAEADVVAGETAVIHCEAVGGPNVALSWFRTPLESDTPITELFPSERVVISPRELVIFNVRPEEEGFYFCMAKNEVGEITSRFGQLNVQTPPEFTPGLIVNYLVVEGARPSLVLPCSGTGDPEPDLHWLRDNVVLPHGINEQRILPDGSLEIFSPGPQDEGDYACRLANAAGERFLTFNVRVRAIPRVQIDPSGPELTIDVGAQLSLFCSDMRTEPEELEQLRWFRNGERLETGGNIVVFPKTGELVISDMQISDSANYTCEIRSYAGKDNATVLVTVEDPLLASGVMTTPLSVSSPTPLTQTISEGQVAQFVCVTSRPPPGTEIEVEWLKNGEALRNLKRYRIEEVEAGSLLTILDVRVTDEATYSCTASNRIGEVESIDFNLILSTRPIITWAPESRDITEGENITLSCKAVGRPDPEIMWLFNGQPIRGCLFEHESSNTISVCNTTASSSRGWYSCLANNIAGTTEFSIYVNVSSVTVAPNITSRSESEVISAGDSLILDCLATGVPLPTITWFKNGVRLMTTCSDPSGGACVIVGMDDSVYIRDTQLSDSGTYTCVASNTAGEAVYEVHIQVEPSAELPQFEVFPRILNQSSALVSVECQTTVDPPADLCWLTADNSVVSKDNADRIYTIGGVLYIVNPVTEDSGQYICRANNSAGINQVSITLLLGEDTSGDGTIRETINEAVDSQEPKFLDAPGNVVTYEGLPVTVPCTTTKSQDDSFTVWRRDKQPLLQDDDITVTTNGSLVIERSKVAHSGEYDCVAVGEDGVLRATISIDIQPRPGPPDLLSSPSDLRVPLGSEFVLPCQPYGVREVMGLSWLLDGEPLESECGEREVREDGSLYVARATNTSAGVYTCRVRNKYATLDARATVTVTDYPINTTLNVEEGDTLYELHCGVPNSAQSIDVQWTQGTHPLPLSPFIIPFGARLLFVSVVASLQGEYTCTHNGDTVSVFLNVLMAPTIVNSSPSLTVSRYDPLALNCITTGNPKPTVTWYLSGEVVHRGVQATSLATGSLYLHPPLPPGELAAVCQASNYLGTASSTTIITTATS